MKNKFTFIANANLFLAKVMGKFVPSCDQVTLLVSDSMDEKLPLKSKLGVAIHLLMCKWCRRFKQQLQLIRTLVRNTPARTDGIHSHSPASLSAAAKERIERALSDSNK